MASNPTPDALQPTAAAATPRPAASRKPAAAKKPAPKPKLAPPTTPEVKRSVKIKANAPARIVAKPGGTAAVVKMETKKPSTTKSDKNQKPKKAKLIRDSFTMPEAEFNLFAEVKRRCIAKGLAVKKSEVLRAAIIAFAAQGDAAVMKALRVLDPIKTGRPPAETK